MNLHLSTIDLIIYTIIITIVAYVVLFIHINYLTKYVICFYDLKTSYSSYTTPVSLKEARIYLKEQKKLYDPKRMHFWITTLEPSTVKYSYERKGKMHIFRKDGQLQVIPENMLPLTDFKVYTKEKE